MFDKRMEKEMIFVVLLHAMFCAKAFIYLVSSPINPYKNHISGAISLTKKERDSEVE